MLGLSEMGDRPLERIEHFDPEREHVAFKGRDKAQWNRWGCICCCVCPCVCVGMGILVSYLTRILRLKVFSVYY